MKKTARIHLKRIMSLLRIYGFRSFTALITPFFLRKRNRIVFSTFDGNGFCDNSKYIALELIKRNLPVELIWLTSPNVKSEFPDKVRRVSNSYFSELYYLSTASVWVDTHFKRHIFKKGLIKRRGQFYIQTWHGSLGIKNIPGVEDLSPALYYPMIFDLKAVDALISNSLYEDIKFRDCFSIGKIQPPIMKLGHPRNDIFFKNNDELVLRIKKQYNIEPGVRIFTYMPTFRKGRSLDAYQLDFNLVLSALKTRFDGKWCIFLRLHPSMTELNSSELVSSPDIIDVTKHPDSQEIQIVSDILCSDYSSCIYDFVLSGKPGFIYTVDLNDYQTARGLRYPLTETPFSISETSSDLANNILSFDEKSYRKSLDAFLKKHGCVDDGKSSERVADLIEDVLNKKQREK